MMSSPPPLPGEKRKSSRIEIIAQVQCRTDGEVYILRARNASEGGLFLEGSAADHPLLRPGVEVSLGLLPDEFLDTEPIALRGRVVRVDAGGPGRKPGFGVQITGIGPKSRQRFLALLRLAK